MYLKEFDKCPICKCKETVSHLACADEVTNTGGVFLSLEKVFVPIQQPGKILGSTMRGLLIHYDCCAKCGTRYCTRAEVVEAPVTLQTKPGFNPLKGFNS